MTTEQQETLTKCIGMILDFYQLGKDGVANPPRPGGFARRFAEAFPDSFEENMDFIFMIDRLVIASYRAGEKHSPPFN